MGQRCIQIGCFVGHFQTCFFVGAVLDLPHQVHTVGNDNQDDPHVFGKRQKQIAEVFRLNDGAFGIQLVDFDESPYDAGHVFSIFLFDRIQTAKIVFHGFMEHDSQNRGAAHADFFGHDDSRLHILDNGIHLEYISWNGTFCHRLDQMGFQLVAVILL